MLIMIVVIVVSMFHEKITMNLYNGAYPGISFGVTMPTNIYFY